MNYYSLPTTVQFTVRGGDKPFLQPFFPSTKKHAIIENSIRTEIKENLGRKVFAADSCLWRRIIIKLKGVTKVASMLFFLNIPGTAVNVLAVEPVAVVLKEDPTGR